MELQDRVTGLELDTKNVLERLERLERATYGDRVTLSPPVREEISVMEKELKRLNEMVADIVATIRQMNKIIWVMIVIGMGTFCVLAAHVWITLTR